MTKGFMTSEFWLTFLAGAAGVALQYGGIVPGVWGYGITAGLVGVYGIYRTIYKVTHPGAVLPPVVVLPEAAASGPVKP